MTILPKINFVRRLLTWTIWLLVAIGVAFRLTVQDRYRLWCLIYYVTPISALPIWFLIAGFVGSPGRTWRRTDQPNVPSKGITPARFNLLLGLLCLGWAIWTQCQLRATQPSSKDFRLVFWNVARIFAPVPRLAEQIRFWDAPIVALVEAQRNYRKIPAEWTKELPGYQVVTTHYGGLVAVKGTVISSQFHDLTHGSWCEQFELRVDGVEFTLLLADISSELARLRRRPLEELAKIADALSDRPLIIAGDFNTPDDSVWFGPLREHHRQAFRERGNGYAPTWPVPLPVLMLDQVWFNQHVDVSSCRHAWTTNSDHRPVITELSIPRPQRN